MNVIDQALNVVQQTEVLEGQVTLTLDLQLPEHRAALAAAAAVLRSFGEDASTLIAAGVATPDEVAGERAASESPRASRSVPSPASESEGEDEAETAGDGTLRQEYGDAVGELTPDAERKARIVRETFPRVRSLLRDGANVASVAQIQYRRWVEENPEATRRN